MGGQRSPRHLLDVEPPQDPFFDSRFPFVLLGGPLLRRVLHNGSDPIALVSYSIGRLSRQDRRREGQQQGGHRPSHHDRSSTELLSTHHVIILPRILRCALPPLFQLHPFHKGGSSGFCVGAIQFPPLCKGRLGGVEPPALYLPAPLLTKEGTPFGTTHVLPSTHTISGRTYIIYDTPASAISEQKNGAPV